MLPADSLNTLALALDRLREGFATLPPLDTPEESSPAIQAVLQEAATRLQDNYPYFHPLYAGQMLKPPHPVARLAYALAQYINPNNHALDGGRASSQMEQEAVASLAAIFGWCNPPAGAGYLGHLTSGGTFANLEALWIAGQLTPGGRILASEQAHYTHSRISSVLGLPFTAIPCDHRGRMSPDALAEELRRGNVAAVVATMGATATGAVDPLHDILKLRQEFNFRIHADAAYGGYFSLASNLLPETRAAFNALPLVDSIVIDPHKHGLQPYGCGCILFRSPEVGRFYQHNSPYTYFTSNELHLGEISLECSRAGAAAVALWATQRLLPLTPSGEFAQGLAKSRNAALSLHQRISADPRFLVPFAPELDILNFAVRAATPEDSSRLARAIFDHAAQLGLHLALAQLPLSFFSADTFAPTSATHVTCLRSVLMKPEHLDWIDRIWQRIDAAALSVLA